MKALDLFCGAGGVSAGLVQAGFEVVGVDAVFQPNYPFEFEQGDAMRRRLKGFDFVWCSPPCQRYSTMSARFRGKLYPDYIPQLRKRLKRWGGPWVIENVPGAPLLDPVRLCGAGLGLSAHTSKGICWLKRHRLFESNLPLSGSACECKHKTIIGVYGEGDGGNSRGWKGSFSERQAVMGINWMNRRELSQSIPPAYAKFLGDQIIKLINEN